MRGVVKEENSANMQFINTKNKIKGEVTNKELDPKKKSKIQIDRLQDLMRTRIHRYSRNKL